MNGEKTGDGNTTGKKEGGGCGGRTRERSNEAEAGTPESTTAGSLWNPAVPPEWRKKPLLQKKEEWHNFRL